MCLWLDSARVLHDAMHVQLCTWSLWRRRRQSSQIHVSPTSSFTPWSGLRRGSLPRLRQGGESDFTCMMQSRRFFQVRAKKGVGWGLLSARTWYTSLHPQTVFLFFCTHYQSHPRHLLSTLSTSVWTWMKSHTQLNMRHPQHIRPTLFLSVFFRVSL